MMPDITQLALGVSRERQRKGRLCRIPGAGGIKTLRLLPGQLHLMYGFCVVVARLNKRSGELGDAIVDLFVASG